MTENHANTALSWIPSDLIINLQPDTFTFAMIKPDGFRDHLSSIMANIIDAGFLVSHRDQMLSATDIRALYYPHLGRDYYDRNAEFIGSGTVRLMILRRPEAISFWRSMVKDLRDKWADQEVKCQNVVHGADEPVAALRESLYFFGRG